MSDMGGVEPAHCQEFYLPKSIKRPRRTKAVIEGIVHQLRDLVRECIERHVDKHQIDMLRVAEASEREIITKWAAICVGVRA